jgi:hypothetical protein
MDWMDKMVLGIAVGCFSLGLCLAIWKIGSEETRQPQEIKQCKQFVVGSPE